MNNHRQQARLYMDGNMWCAVLPGFRNLAIDDAGFGETQEEAVADLERARAADFAMYSVQYSRVFALSVDDFVVGGFCRQCREWVPENEKMDGCRDPDCPCQQ